MEVLLNRIFASKGKFLPTSATEDDLSKTTPQRYLTVGAGNVRVEMEIQNQSWESGSKATLGPMRGFGRLKQQDFSCEIQALCPGRYDQTHLSVHSAANLRVPQPQRLDPRSPDGDAALQTSKAYH